MLSEGSPVGLKVPKAFNYPLSHQDMVWIYRQRTDQSQRIEGGGGVGKRTMTSEMRHK